MDEHGKRADQPMYRHLSNCNQFKNYVSLFNLPSCNESRVSIDFSGHLLNAVLNNYVIIDYNDSWSQLCFLEAYYIKQFSPVINKGLKASKELQLFS